jgi:hypothetical protein
VGDPATAGCGPGSLLAVRPEVAAHRRLALPDRNAILARAKELVTWRSALVFAFLGAVLAFYIWTANTSANPIHFGDTQGDRYNALSDGLIHGRASLLTPPDPGLLALKDPYDPVANQNYRLAGVHDLSLYHGRFYLYWGPTPAVTLFIPFRVLGVGKLPEALAAVIYAFAGLIFSLLLFRFLIRRYLPDTPFWMQFAGLVMLAVGNTAPFILRRPGVYEVAIAAGYCFMFAGLYFLLTGALRDRPSLVRLALGSAAFGLAIGARPPQLIVAFSTVAVLVYLIRAGKAPLRSDKLRLAAAVLGPLAVAGVLLLIYNYVRFDSFTEFGQRYQLAGVEVAKRKMFDPAYIPPGLYYFLLAPVRWAFAFPYAFLPPPPYYPFHVPKTYDGVEIVGGALVNLPILLLLAGLPFMWRRSSGRSRELLLVVGGMTAAGFLLVVLVSWTLWGATMRYEMDFSALLLVAALVVWFALAARARPRKAPRRVLAVVGGLAVLYGAWVSTAIGFNGYGDSLRTFHPGTYRSIAHFFSPLPTLATMVVGHPVLTDIFNNPNGYACPRVNYGTNNLQGASLVVGSTPATVSVISPGGRKIAFQAGLAPGQQVPPGSKVSLHVHGSGSDVTVPVTGGAARIPLHANTGLNEYVFEAVVSPPPPASPTPPLQLIQVNRLTLHG